jgi:hypothetical protein
VRLLQIEGRRYLMAQGAWLPDQPHPLAAVLASAAGGGSSMANAILSLEMLGGVAGGFGGSPGPGPHHPKGKRRETPRETRIKIRQARGGVTGAVGASRSKGGGLARGASMSHHAESLV